MGFFDKFKSTPRFVQSEDTSDSISLKKTEAVKKLNLRKETVTVCLRKSNADNIIARVALVMDKSYSMKFMYDSGEVQEVIERLLPVGIKFDDNGELDMWIFNDDYERIAPATENVFFNYVQNEVTSKYPNWGGTLYTPVMKDITRKYIKEEPSDLPTFVIFITDGDNDDHREAENVIVEAAKHNIFWQFVGIGNKSFSFLKKLDTFKGRVVDNANFFQLDDIDDIDDTELYNRLFEEFPQWIQKAKAKGILK